MWQHLCFVCVSCNPSLYLQTRLGCKCMPHKLIAAAAGIGSFKFQLECSRHCYIYIFFLNSEYKTLLLTGKLAFHRPRQDQLEFSVVAVNNGSSLDTCTAKCCRFHTVIQRCFLFHDSLYEWYIFQTFAFIAYLFSLFACLFVRVGMRLFQMISRRTPLCATCKWWSATFFYCNLSTYRVLKQSTCSVTFSSSLFCLKTFVLS